MTFVRADQSERSVRRVRLLHVMVEMHEPRDRSIVETMIANKVFATWSSDLVLEYNFFTSSCWLLSNLFLLLNVRVNDEERL